MYMDQFTTPEEYLLYQISLNKGANSCIMKEKLLRLAAENQINATAENKKWEIAQALLSKKGAKWLAEQCEHFGVPSYCFQKKFGIRNSDVKQLARSGFLEITGSERFTTMYGVTNYASLYSVFQYYSLTPSALGKALRELAYRKKEEN